MLIEGLSERRFDLIMEEVVATDETGVWSNETWDDVSGGIKLECEEEA